jgi:hypothetical protein
MGPPVHRQRESSAGRPPTGHTPGAVAGYAGMGLAARQQASVRCCRVPGVPNVRSAPATLDAIPGLREPGHDDLVRADKSVDATDELSRGVSEERHVECSLITADDRRESCSSGCRDCTERYGPVGVATSGSALWGAGTRMVVDASVTWIFPGGVGTVDRAPRCPLLW